MDVRYYQRHGNAYTDSRIYPPIRKNDVPIGIEVEIRESFTSEHLREIINRVKDIEQQINVLRIGVRGQWLLSVKNSEIHELGEVLHGCLGLHTFYLYRCAEHQMAILIRRIVNIERKRMLFCAQKTDQLESIDEYDVYLFVWLTGIVTFHKDQFPLPIDLIRMLYGYIAT